MHRFSAAFLILLITPFAIGARPPAGITTATVEKRGVSDRVEAIGTLRARESVELTATVGERVVEIGFEDGDRVGRGDVLVRLSSTEEEALLKEASSAAREAELQYERAKQLAARGTASAAQLDEARRVHETARARQLAIESRLEDLVIKAPFDGLTGLRDISVGAVVRPGDTVTTIDDDSVMLLDFTVPSRHLGLLVPGTPIEAAGKATGTRHFKGSVRGISSRIDTVTRTVRVRAEIPNPERILRPGMLMDVDLLGNRREAIVVPEGTLLPDAGENFVMVVEDGPSGHIARRRHVETGARIEGFVEILSGLSEGERVAEHGAFKLRDGSPVRILESPVATD